MVIESEIMEEWCKRVADKMTHEEHVALAEAYEKLAKHYENLAKEARTHAESHRQLISSGI